VGHEVDHSPTCSAGVKNEWCCTVSHRICHNGMDRDNFTFNFPRISSLPSELTGV